MVLCTGMRQVISWHGPGRTYLTSAYWNPPLYYRAYLRIEADLAYGTLWQTFTSRRFWRKAIRIALGKY